MKLDKERLQRAREMLGYGLEKTAQEAGVSKNSVLRAEHEEDIRPGTARKIAEALRVPVADLIGGSETLKAQPPLPDLWGKWRSQLELLESCVQYKIGRAEYYERELERSPSPVDLRVAEEYEAKVDAMLGRSKQTTDLLFKHAYRLAETAEQRNELATRRRQAEERTAYGEMRSA